ncbi:peptide synthase, partial [Burkholderia pseudomallei]
RGLDAERPQRLVHPTGGTEPCSRDHARPLGPAPPLSALQDPGLDGDAGYDSGEALAERHVAHFRPRAGDGAGDVGGWSSGGGVA